MKKKNISGGAMQSYYYDPNDPKLMEEATLFRLRKKISRLSFSFIVYTLTAYVAIFILQLIVSLLGLSEILEKSVYWQFAMAVLPLYVFGLPAICLLLKSMKATPIKKSRMNIGDFLLLFLIGRFFTLVGSYTSSFLISVTERLFRTQINDTTTELLERIPTWLILIAAVLIGPIVEEFIYRKLIIDRLHPHGEMFAILFSSAVFALAHGNLYQVVYAFLNGCILGLIYIRTGRLLYSCIFHIATNFLGSIVVLPIIEAQEALQALEQGGVFNSEYLSLTLLIGGYGFAKFFLAILGAAVLCLRYRHFLPRRYGLDPIPHGKTTSLLLKSPGFIAFLAFSALEFILSLF